MFLWAGIFFQKLTKSLRICMRLFLKNRKGTSFFARQKASLTIEAAVVIPITIGVLACILFLFRMIQVQVAIEECLMYVGRNLAVESCILDSEETMFLTAEMQLLDALDEHKLVEQYVRYGRYGVSLGKSKFEGENITLCAEYEMKLSVRFFEIDGIQMSSVNQFRKWKGSNAEGELFEYVYVTESGRVYHQNLNCRVLDLSVSSIPLFEVKAIRGSDGQKYYPCELCLIQMDTDVVFYTNYGTRYHGDISCSALKRTVKKILKTESGNKKACSFCFP